jgi:chromosome segregation ATPase
MFIKVVQSLLVMSIFSFTLASSPQLNLENLTDEKISKEDNKKVINLLVENANLTPQQKLDRDIELLKKDISKWQKMQDELLSIKKEYEKAYNTNEQKINDYEQEVIRLKAELEKTGEHITDQSEFIEMKQKLVGDPTLDAEQIVTFDLANGDKINLIKHITVKGETLTMIALKSFSGQDVTREELEFRKKTILNINSQLSNTDNFDSDVIVYVPFFK